MDTVQGTLTAVKRQDPLVFFGSVYYAASLGTGPFHIGDFAGTRLGVFLAATPNTSLFFDIDVFSTTFKYGIFSEQAKLVHHSTAPGLIGIVFPVALGVTGSTSSFIASTNQRIPIARSFT